MTTTIPEITPAPVRVAPRRAPAVPARRGVAPSSAFGVVHIAAEYSPLARTGGLGEAVSGLARFQASEGIRTTVVMPLYRQVRNILPLLEPMETPIEVALGARQETARFFQLPDAADKPRVFLVEHAGFFDRPGVYGEDDGDYADNAIRFAFLCAAALEALPRIAPEARVLHAHDWHAALAPVYLRARFRGRPFYDRLAALLSVHNAGFQGHFPPDMVATLGLPASLYDWRHFEWYGRMNLLKGGLSIADVAVTVSRTHARELRTEEGGFGLHQTFAAMGDRLVGILNGIDANAWDPEVDPCIAARYSARDLRGKAACKAALQRACGWPERPETPLIGMSARLVEQKGLDLVLGADLLGKTDAQFVILGSGRPHYRAELIKRATARPDRIVVGFEFSDVAEHRLLAGADVLLMPSLYEPCGLTQMRAQRYGTIPVARAVGGLRDSIEDGSTGLLFEQYTPAALEAALGRALACYRDPTAWSRLVLGAMAQPLGWEVAAAQYLEVYRRAVARAVQRPGRGRPNE